MGVNIGCDYGFLRLVNKLIFPLPMKSPPCSDGNHSSLLLSLKHHSRLSIRTVKIVTRPGQNLNFLPPPGNHGLVPVMTF